MTDFFEQHRTYVLVGRDQYEVFLDNKSEPSEMWSTILFGTGSKITIESGTFKIAARQRIGMGLNKYVLVRA